MVAHTVVLHSFVAHLDETLHRPLGLKNKIEFINCPKFDDPFPRFVYKFHICNALSAKATWALQQRLSSRVHWSSMHLNGNVLGENLTLNMISRHPWAIEGRFQ